MTLTIANAEIVQPCCCFHETIRTARQGIAQGVLNTPRTFDTRDGVLDADADPREGAIVPFVTWGEVVTTGLFFG